MTDGNDESHETATGPKHEPLGNFVDVGEWDSQAPPADFAERVLSRIRAEEANVRAATDGERPSRRTIARPRSRRWGAIAGGAVAFAIAAAVVVRSGAVPAHGAAIARDRTEVAIGTRALAVLEPGANVRWDGDHVVQSQGDVFYRVEPGARFTVHTPAGDIEVKGTCFAVKVRPIGGSTREDTEMMKRDVKAGAVGAALSALAFVAVYEGKIAISHASETIDLRAGETAQTGPNGIRRTGGTADGEKAFGVAAAAAAAENPVDEANQNLVRQVGEYRARLEAIVAQKTELETKLKKTEETLAAAQDGAAPRMRHEFDLGQDDWKELAKDGTIKYQMPCLKNRQRESWSPSPETLNSLGLAPHDGETIKNAYTRSNERVWGAIKPLCAQALGSADLAEKIGPQTCIHLVLDIESERNNDAAKAARKQVGEIRAGLRPMPGPNEAVHPVLRLFLATTGETKNFEAELAQAFGPEEAHRIVYSNELCMGASTFGGSPPPKP